MAVKTVTNCVDCETCVDCERGRLRKAVICDVCGNEIYEKVYDLDGNQACEECYLESGLVGYAEDIADEEE